MFDEQLKPNSMLQNFISSVTQTLLKEGSTVLFGTVAWLSHVRKCAPKTNTLTLLPYLLTLYPICQTVNKVTSPIFLNSSTFFTWSLLHCQNSILLCMWTISYCLRPKKLYIKLFTKLEFTFFQQNSSSSRCSRRGHAVKRNRDRSRRFCRFCIYEGF